MADKDFKTIDEQIEILRSRGLTIEDEAEAKDFLLRNNYYRVSLPRSKISKTFTISTMSSVISSCTISKPLRYR